MALRNNPSLQAGQERIAAAEGLRKQANLMLNPRLVLQNENYRPAGHTAFARDTDSFVYLTQTLETAGRRDKRTGLASAAVRRAELERQLLERQIAGRVKEAYWMAAGAKLAETMLSEDVRNFGRIIEYHEIRVREGAMAEIDLIRVRLEGERLALELNNATLQAERARLNLYREMGQTEFPEIRFSENVEGVTEGPADGVQFALENRPEIKLARQIVEQARSNLTLQQAAARPNVEVLLGYKRTSGFNTTIGGVQMDLPFANRNQGNIEAATAEIRFAEASLAVTQALIRAEVNAAQRDYEIRRRQVGDFLKGMRTKAEEGARIAEAAYREGGTDLLRLLDAQRLRIETQVLYYRALAEFRQSIAALETALGVTQ